MLAFRGLCSHGGEELFGGRSCRAEFLLTPLRTLRGKTLGVALGLGQYPFRLSFCFANDVGGGCLQASLIDDRRRFCARGLARSHERFLCLSQTLFGGYLGFLKEALGCLSVSLGSQSSTLERRVRLRPAALEYSIRLCLFLGYGALARHKLALNLAGLLGGATRAKPLAHELEVAINLSRVIAFAHQPEVTLDDVGRTSLPFSTGGHSPAFASHPTTPSPARLGRGGIDCARAVLSLRFVRDPQPVPGAGRPGGWAAQARASGFTRRRGWSPLGSAAAFTSG